MTATTPTRRRIPSIADRLAAEVATVERRRRRGRVAVVQGATARLDTAMADARRAEARSGKTLPNEAFTRDTALLEVLTAITTALARLAGTDAPESTS